MPQTVQATSNHFKTDHSSSLLFILRKFIDSLVVRAGEWDRGTTKEIIPHQDRQISEVIEHEHYHSGGLLNDIALLILREPMVLADNVDTICLPTQDYNFDYAQCLASGWGKGNFGKFFQLFFKFNCFESY